MTRAGFTPAQALQTATTNPARFLGRQKSAGSIEAGKAADLVLLAASPLDDIRNTRRIEAVVIRGRLLARPDARRDPRRREARRRVPLATTVGGRRHGRAPLAAGSAVRPVNDRDGAVHSAPFPAAHQMLTSVRRFPAPPLQAPVPGNGGGHDGGSAGRDRFHLRGLCGGVVHPRRIRGRPHGRVRPAAGGRGRAAVGRAPRPVRARRRRSRSRARWSSRCRRWSPAARRCSTAWRRRSSRSVRGAADVQPHLGRPRPRPAPQGAALVRHLRRRLRRRLPVPQSPRRAAAAGGVLRLPLRGRAVRRFRARARRRADAAGGGPEQGPHRRRRSRAGRGDRARGPLPLPWPGRLGLRVHAGGRGPGPRLRAGHEDRLRGHRLPRRHVVPRGAARARATGGGWAGASRASSPASASAWTRPTG